MFTRVPIIIYLIVYLNLLGVTMLKFNETNYWNEKKNIFKKIWFSIILKYLRGLEALMFRIFLPHNALGFRPFPNSNEPIDV